MAYVGLDTGSAANAGDGSTLRAGGNIVNANFEEIYNYFGDGSTLSFAGGNWVEVATGINTLSYVGIGTTNPTNPLTVLGAGNISGILTADSFSGIGSFSDVVVSGATTFNGNAIVGAAITFYASTGFMSATKYYGDGSALLSVPSGLGTALSADTSSALNKIYYVNSTLSVGSTITVDPPDSSQVAFTNHPNVVVDGTYDLIVADGDDFIPDILGIGTTGTGGVLSGGGGRVRADNFSDRGGAGAPGFPHGINITGVGTLTTLKVGTAITAESGVVTATRFVGNVDSTNVDASGNFYAVTGVVTTFTAVNSLSVTNDAIVSGALTVTGNMTVEGTQTIINTSTLDVEDKTVGLGSTSSPSNTTADGAGIEIYGGSDENKTVLWQNSNNCFEFSTPVKVKGVNEAVGAAVTYTDSVGNMVIELDLETNTVFTHTIPAVSSSGRGANIGIVSFKNMPANAQSGMTVTLLTTQGAAHGGGTGYGNTIATNGIGVTCTIIPKASGSEVAGIQTRAQSGGTGLLQPPAGITTVVLSPGKDATDFISFFVHYTGGTNTSVSSYKVYVTKNAGFGFGSVGI